MRSPNIICAKCAAGFLNVEDLERHIQEMEDATHPSKSNPKERG